MASERDNHETRQPHPPADQRGTDAGDLVLAALDFIRGFPEGGCHSSGPPPLARQKAGLERWADHLGILLDAKTEFPDFERGGQEHDFVRRGDRVFKATRNGVFGLSPGIELALVSSDDDARRFHLWEATPLDHFINDTLKAGHQLQALRTVTTVP